MAKKSPKRQAQVAPDPAPAKPKALPVTVKNPLPPDAVKRMREFYKESYEIERQWRSING